jgi:uncharacterized protein YoxC
LFNKEIKEKQDIQNAVDRIKSLPDEVIDLPKVVDMKSSLRRLTVKISASFFCLTKKLKRLPIVN